VQQAFHRHAYCSITVAGMNVTGKLTPFLISVRVLLTNKEVSRCDLEIDDRNAEMGLPPPGTTIQVDLGWAASGPDILPEVSPTPDRFAQPPLAYEGGSRIVFTGVIQETEHGYARGGGGRRLWITGFIPDLLNEGKSPGMESHGEGDPDDSGQGQGVPFSDVVSSLAKKGGFNAVVEGSIGGLKRDSWSVAASPYAWIHQMAEELGAKVRPDPQSGNTLIIEPRRAYPEGTVEAVAGMNLIASRIKPYIPRPQWADAKRDFFDIPKGSWMDTIKKISNGLPFGQAAARFATPGAAAPNKDVGGQQSSGDGEESSASAGTGWILMNGEPDARLSGRVTLDGVRPGVDGNYGITEVEHTYSRRGFTTRVSVDDPSGAGLSDAFRSYGWQLNNEPPEEPETSTPHQGNPPIEETPQPTPPQDVPSV
jgi:hypothetical protein